jgi:topoisomerase-4 subunit A
VNNNKGLEAMNDIEEPGIENFEEPKTSASGTVESHKTIHLSGMYENWFLDYASYVILERAVPDLKDGLKPVQRRILHAMRNLDDGRYNKVANIIGHTMQYHPHGDASIGDALVQLGQKDILIDMQGNWGNILTGDSAAAPRYIEARLSKLANDVVFNPKTTAWKSSYDGRNKEPVTLPVKFPLLLAQGVEGIAVGLASKILPHNFNELLDASVNILRNEDFELYPDFPTGGLADVSKYNDGLRGGRIRIRAKISQVDKKTLTITEIPFGTTTTSLIESIVTANDKGKIKIKKIDDNTAENVEILIQLAPNVSPDQTIDALYAFTDCEISVSPNSCVIDEGKPRFLGVRLILQTSVENTVALLKSELEIRKEELLEQWHFSSLEKIFIEKRIYRKIEECETWEAVIEAIDKGLKPYRKLLHRDITQDDILKLTEIKIKRISKFNSNKADEIINGIELEIDEVNNHLEHLIDYAVNYFRQIKKKYGAGRERKTELRNFDVIEATRVAAATQKLYVNREEGFAGTTLRKDEYVCDCSDIDDIIVFREDGTFLVTKVAAKIFVGHNIVYINVFQKNDDRTIYNVIFRDGKKGIARVKRFAVTGMMRDKEYTLTKGTENSKILYFTANPNGEAEVVKIFLKPKPKLRKLTFEYDFSQLEIKGKGSQGNIITKQGIKSIIKREEGVSTLGARDLWYDDTVKRLNTEGRGKHLGAFKSDDKILTIQQSGFYKLMNYDLSNHFEEDMIVIEKFNPDRVISAVYFETSSDSYYLKRFRIEGDNGVNKKIDFIGENPENRLVNLSLDRLPRIQIVYDPKTNKKEIPELILNADEFIGIKSPKAKGKRITTKATLKIEFIEPLPFNEPEGDTKEAEPVISGEDEIMQDIVPDDLSEIQTAGEPEEEKPVIVPVKKEKRKEAGDDSVKQMELF